MSTGRDMVATFGADVLSGSLAQSDRRPQAAQPAGAAQPGDGASVQQAPASSVNLTMRQAHFPFGAPLNRNAVTSEQRRSVERAQRLSQTARGCGDIERAASGSGSDRPADPGPVRLDTVEPSSLRALLSRLPVGRASRPVVDPEGVTVLMICRREVQGGNRRN